MRLDEGPTKAHGAMLRGCLMLALQGKHGSLIHEAGVTFMSLTSRIPIPLTSAQGWMDAAGSNSPP